MEVISHSPDYIVSTSDGVPLTLPRICTVLVNGERVEITERMTFKHMLTLPRMDNANDAWEVFSEAEELLEVTDRVLYILSTPCYNLELNIVNESKDLIEVQEVSITSAHQKLKEIVPGATWACESGLLSGTALVVSWKPRLEKQASPVT
jgi:hypothetical protein